MRRPWLRALGTDRDRRYVAVGERRGPWPDAAQRRVLAGARARYIGGELSLQEYEAEIERVLRTTPPPPKSSAPLRLQPQPRSDVRVLMGAGAALLVTAGFVLARTLRRPVGAERLSGPVAPTVVIVDVFAARWHVERTGY